MEMHNKYYFHYLKMIIIIPQKLVHMQTGQTIGETSGSQNFRPIRGLRTSSPAWGPTVGDRERRPINVAESTFLGKVVAVTHRNGSPDFPRI